MAEFAARRNGVAGVDSVAGSAETPSAQSHAQSQSQSQTETQSQPRTQPRPRSASASATTRTSRATTTEAATTQNGVHIAHSEVNAKPPSSLSSLSDRVDSLAASSAAVSTSVSAAVSTSAAHIASDSKRSDPAQSQPPDLQQQQQQHTNTNAHASPRRPQSAHAQVCFVLHMLN